VERGCKGRVPFRVIHKPIMPADRPGKGTPLVTIVRTTEGAQGSGPEVVTALDELAREGTCCMILASLEVEMEEYREGTATHATAAAMRWWSETGRLGRVA
jgi:hypothetical protein